jgi:hypothetical protein
MEAYQVIVLFVCGALFGYVAKKLTTDEKEIYKGRQYFPAFKILLFFASLILLFVNQDIASVCVAILIMILVWDFDKKNKGKRK